jgi:hypothetical protein
VEKNTREEEKKEKKKFKHEGEIVILTEGPNDCHVISALCEMHSVPEPKDSGFYYCGSDKQVLQRMSALINGPEPIKIIGVILDADAPNLQSKWASLKHKLGRNDYQLPEFPEKNGTIVNLEGMPRIGIWLMPDNNVDGMLEDFCRRLVDDDAIEFASDCVEQAKDKGITTFKDNHYSKAVIHTFLAWQAEPGMPLGQAITAKALDGHNPLARNFSDFLKRLFEDA